MKTLLIGMVQGPTIGVSLMAGALAWASIGLLFAAFHRWRERGALHHRRLACTR